LIKLRENERQKGRRKIRNGKTRTENQWALGYC